MSKYYTRACNFYYGKSSIEMLKKKKALPMHGNNELSFDTVEILSRKNKRKINIKNINTLSNNLKKIIKSWVLKYENIRDWCGYYTKQKD